MVSTKLLKPARREYEPRFPNLSSSLGFRKQAVREWEIYNISQGSCQSPITNQQKHLRKRKRNLNMDLWKEIPNLEII